MGLTSKEMVVPTNKVTCPYCGCDAELVGGAEIYPHRADLHGQWFWRCAPCVAYVGCHKPNPKMGFDGTQPLGRLANAELRKAKTEAHAAFDPLWKTGKLSRRKAYAWLAGSLGIPISECHIGEFDVTTCARVVSLSRSYPGASTRLGKRKALLGDKKVAT